MSEDEVDDATEEMTLLRKVGIAAAVLAGTVVLGAVIGTVMGAGTRSSGDVAPITAIQPVVTAGELIPAPKVKPKKLDEPRGIGSKVAGISLVAFSEVESARTEKGVRTPPTGSRMYAFQVDDWTCEEKPCADWSALTPQVSIDGDLRALEEGTDRYVVVVPPGTDRVDLVVDADGFTQSLPLLGDNEGRNITLLARKGLEEPVPVQQRFQLTERTSQPLTGPDGLLTDTFYRTVTVGEVQRHFFFKGATPKSPTDAFVVVTASYAYPNQQGASAFDPAEFRFVAGNGTSYTARDLDPADDIALMGFEVPASVKAGTLVFGGTVPKVSTTGVSYTTTLAEKRIKVRFPAGEG